MYSSAVLQGVRPLFSQILPGQGSPPSAVFGIIKLETAGYPTVKTAYASPSAFPRFDTILECDEQTDGQTDLP